jgi:hypothetical protein
MIEGGGVFDTCFLLTLHQFTGRNGGSVSMPYFVRVGTFVGATVKLGSRGYHIYRRGRTVFTVWGGVIVKRGRKVRIEWARATENKRYVCSSERAAIAKYLALVAQRTGKEHYDRLPSGQKIIRTAQAPLGHRRR